MEISRSRRVSSEHDVLSEERKRFQQINPTIPTIILDAEGDVVFMTSAARHLLGLKKDQVPTGSFFVQVHERQQLLVMRDVADMVGRGKMGANWLLRLRTGSGRWEWFRATVRNLLDQEEAHISVVLRAVSEL